MKSLITWFRVIAFTEGVSYLLLLFVAMPLKYFFDTPLAVRYVGMAHGVLFMAYIPFLFLAARPLKWDFAMIFRGFFASLVPGGTFLLDRQIVKDEKLVNEP